jgi:hypothetical protein
LVNVGIGELVNDCQVSKSQFVILADTPLYRQLVQIGEETRVFRHRGNPMAARRESTFFDLVFYGVGDEAPTHDRERTPVALRTTGVNEHSVRQ